MSERQIKAVTYIKENEKITNKEYLGINDCSRNTATNDLRDLIKKRDKIMKNSKKVRAIPPMNDEELAKFWDNNEPEDFEGWKEGTMKFTRPPKKLIQLRLDPRDVRIIDRESKRSGIDRAQLVRSWVKEKISRIHNDEKLGGASDRKFWPGKNNEKRD